jgi:hypothetical protein
MRIVETQTIPIRAGQKLVAAAQQRPARDHFQRPHQLRPFDDHSFRHAAQRPTESAVVCLSPVLRHRRDCTIASSTAHGRFACVCRRSERHCAVQLAEAESPSRVAPGGGSGGGPSDGGASLAAVQPLASSSLRPRPLHRHVRVPRRRDARTCKWTLRVPANAGICEHLQGARTFRAMPEELPCGTDFGLAT